MTIDTQPHEETLYSSTEICWKGKCKPKKNKEYPLDSGICNHYFHMIQGYDQYIISNNNQNRYTGKAEDFWTLSKPGPLKVKTL